MRNIHNMGMNLQTHTMRNARYKSRQQDSAQIEKEKLNYGDRNQYNYCLRLHNEL